MNAQGVLPDVQAEDVREIDQEARFDEVSDACPQEGGDR
jgi:hypothetical protein